VANVSQILAERQVAGERQHCLYGQGQYMAICQQEKTSKFHLPDLFKAVDLADD
jgi:hypothetical protein